MSLKTDIVALAGKEGTLVNNKVCNFAYDNTAYEDDTSTGADGVATYNYNNHNNIPIKDNSVLKVNPTITAKGFRTQVSTLPRMLMNHIFGRVSYNLNKTVDVLYALLTELASLIGEAYGLATLDGNGRVPYSQLPLSAVEYKGAWKADTNTPQLSAGTGTFGDEYIVSVAGTQNLGEGSTLFLPSDRIIYNGSIWQKISSGAVRKVNNISPDTNGNVALNADNIVTPDVYGYNEADAGKIWTKATGVVNNLSFNDICAHNGLFVACKYSAGGTGNTAYYSEDGIHWTEADNHPQHSGDIKYLNGKFVAYGAQIYTSDDGKTWTQVSNLSNIYANDIEFAEGLYVLADSNSGVYWSTDLINWTLGKTLYYAYRVYFADGLWILREYGSQSFSYNLYWSEDGKSWTECTGYQATMDSQSCYFSSVVYGNGIWLACARGVSATSFKGIWKSTDGKAWTKVSELDTYSGISNVYFLNNKWILTYYDSLFVSEDNTTWTQTYIGIQLRNIWFENGLYLGKGNTYLYWSSNLTDWTRATGVAESSFNIAFSNRTWVGVSGNGIYYSKGTATNNVSEILDWLLTEVDRLEPAPSLAGLYIYAPESTGNIADGFNIGNLSDNYRTILIATKALTEGENTVMLLQDIITSAQYPLFHDAAKIATVDVEIISYSGACGDHAHAVTYNGVTKNYTYYYATIF